MGKLYRMSDDVATYYWAVTGETSCGLDLLAHSTFLFPLSFFLLCFLFSVFYHSTERKERKIARQAARVWPSVGCFAVQSSLSPRPPNGPFQPNNGNALY